MKSLTLQILTLMILFSSIGCSNEDKLPEKKEHEKSHYKAAIDKSNEASQRSDERNDLLKKQADEALKGE